MSKYYDGITTIPEQIYFEGPSKCVLSIHGIVNFQDFETYVPQAMTPPIVRPSHLTHILDFLLKFRPFSRL